MRGEISQSAVHESVRLSFRAKREISLPGSWIHLAHGKTLLRRRLRGILDMTKNYYVYIMTNRSRTFYVGMTNNLERRVFEHEHKLIEGFTKRYNITRLVYCEVFSNVREAIAREKQIKDWRREKKIALIEPTNPEWKDLSDEWAQ